MVFKNILVSLVAVTWICGCSFRHVLAANVAKTNSSSTATNQSLQGVWQAAGVSCSSGAPVSREELQTASTLTMQFKADKVAKVERQFNCVGVMISPYRVSGNELFFGSGTAEVGCNGQPTKKLHISSGIDHFSLLNNELTIREKNYHGICKSKRDAVIYSFRKIWTI